MKTKTLIILCVVALAACKKDKKENEPVVEQKTYISKEILSIGVNNWVYSQDNYLEHMIFTSTNEAVNSSYNFGVNITDDKGRITDAQIDYTNPAKTDIRIKNVFSANGKLISSTQSNLASGVAINSYTFEYTANTIKFSYKNELGILQYYEIYTLSTDGKNVLKIQRYNDTNDLLSTYELSGFDDKKSVRSVYVPGYTVAPTSINNFTTQSYTDNARGAAPIISTYTYEYNSDGYATKIISASGASNSFQYIKK